MTELKEKNVYPTLPDIRESPSAPAIDDRGHSHRLKVITDILNFLEEESSRRKAFSKKYFRVAKYVGVVDSVLLGATACAEVAAAALLASGVGSPFALGLGVSGAAAGAISLFGNIVVRKTTIRAEKHLKIKTKELQEGLKPIKEGIESVSKAITFPAYPSIEASGGKATQYIGEVAGKYLRKFLTKDEADRDLGIYDKKGDFYIGNKPVFIVDDNIRIDDKEYPGTPGLWDLIVSKEPNNENITTSDLETYKNIMLETNSIYKDNDPSQNRGKSNKNNPKWKTYLSESWDRISKEKQKQNAEKRKAEKKAERKRVPKRQKDPVIGNGLTVIPSNPNALLERLDLLLASQDAGHTGVRNELVSICDELKRQGVISADAYKKINSLIKI